jgi:hypothetical protein
MDAAGDGESSRTVQVRRESFEAQDHQSSEAALARPFSQAANGLVFRTPDRGTPLAGPLGEAMIVAGFILLALAGVVAARRNS